MTRAGNSTEGTKHQDTSLLGWRRLADLGLSRNRQTLRAAPRLGHSAPTSSDHSLLFAGAAECLEG